MKECRAIKHFFKKQLEKIIIKLKLTSYFLCLISGTKT